MPGRDVLRIWKILKKIQLRSNHGVEELMSDHSVEKLKADHGVEKLKSKHAIEGWHWIMQADSWVSAIQLRLEDVVGFFRYLPTGILDITGCAARLWGREYGQRSKNCVSLLMSKNRSQKLINVRTWTTESALVLACVLYLYLTMVVYVLFYGCDWSHHGTQHLNLLANINSSPVGWCCIVYRVVINNEEHLCIQKYKIIFSFLVMILVWSRKAIAESSSTRMSCRETEEPVNNWL